MLEDHYPDFTGKHIQIYLAYKHVVSYLIQDVTFDMQGGRLFLVGRVSEAYEEDVFAKGKPVCIAWECVEQYIIFDTVEAWQKEAAGSRERRERRYEEALKRRAERK